jgi:hypothetical protein
LPKPVGANDGVEVNAVGVNEGAMVVIVGDFVGFEEVFEIVGARVGDVVIAVGSGVGEIDAPG